MPVSCPITLPRLTNEQFGSLDYRVMGIAFGLHNDVGCKWNEAFYQDEMASRLQTHDVGIVHPELPLTVTFGCFTKIYRVDLVVAEQGVYELKAVAKITEAHIGQTINYLRLLNATRAKIINFRPFSLESEFVNCSDTLAQRRQFDIDAGEYAGPPRLKTQAEQMLRDLGTRLSTTLYSGCLVANVGRLETITVGPSRRVGQLFQMIGENEAFVCTALETKQCHHRDHLQRMQKIGQLRAIHWINVTPKVVRFETVI